MIESPLSLIVPPPKSRSELERRINELVVSGDEYSLEGVPHGAGAPGHLLEHLLGIRANNEARADSFGLEIKFHGGAGSSSRITLWHKTPIGGSKKAFRPIFEAGYGNYEANPTGKNKYPKMNLYRIVDGALFTARVRNGLLTVTVNDHPEIPPITWDINDLIQGAMRKLGQSVIVFGKKLKNPDRVVYTGAQYCDQMISYNDISSAISEGTIVPEFHCHARWDNYRQRDGGRYIRDHGTVFRIRRADIHHLWSSSKKVGEVPDPTPTQRRRRAAPPSPLPPSAQQQSPIDLVDSLLQE